MGWDENTLGQVAQFRSKMLDSPDILYDLRNGMPWKSTRKGALSMAYALFELDIRTWIQASENYVVCNASYNIDLVCTQDQLENVQKLRLLCLSELRKEILREKYHDELRNIASIIGPTPGGLGAVNFIGSIFLYHNIRKKAIDSKLRKIEKEIGEKIRIKVA